MPNVTHEMEVVSAYWEEMKGQPKQRSQKDRWRIFGPFNTPTGYVGKHQRPGKNYAWPAVLCGAPSGFRTPDPLIKSQLLYQLS